MVNELRLNNWISVQFDQRKEIQVTVNNIEQLVNHGPEMFMKGITITEEWLIKFGFAILNKTQYISEYIKYFNFRTLKCRIVKNLVFIFIDDYEICMLEFVHQLQNLFQSLTKTELIIVNK